MDNPLQTFSLGCSLYLRKLPHLHHLALKPRHVLLSLWAKLLRKKTQESPLSFTIASPDTPMASSLGFTLIEIILGLSLVAILSAIAIPAYSNFMEKADITQAIVGIKELENKITAYKLDKLELPTTLAEAGLDGFQDPWGNPYQYLNIIDGGPPVTAKARKDKFLVPLNSEYDLYSMGKDGKTKAPLSAKDSWDDVLLANDGHYVGLASAY